MNGGCDLGCGSLILLPPEDVEDTEALPEPPLGLLGDILGVGDGCRAVVADAAEVDFFPESEEPENGKARLQHNINI
jgi:hypothetical protein